MTELLKARFQHNDTAYHSWYDQQYTIHSEDGEEFDCDNVFARTVLGQAFIDWINENLETSIKFESMYFPREYNFEEDQINVTFTLEDLTKVIFWVQCSQNTEVLENLIDDYSTTRSGYIAFHSKEAFNNDPELLMSVALQAFNNVEGEDFESYFDRHCIYDHMYKEAENA